MARTTIDDCLENVDNRFQLVLVAAKRAHEISMGADPLVNSGNDKPAVIALREVAEGLIDASILEKASAREHIAESTVSEEEVAAATTE